MARPKPTGVVHDLREIRWGHNWSLVSAKKRKVEFFVWLHERPRPGDVVLVRSKTGEHHLHVRTVQRPGMSSPDDMYLLHAKEAKK